MWQHLDFEHPLNRVKGWCLKGGLFFKTPGLGAFKKVWKTMGEHGKLGQAPDKENGYGTAERKITKVHLQWIC